MRFLFLRFFCFCSIFLLNVLLLFFLSACAKPVRYEQQVAFPDQGIRFFQTNFKQLPGWKKTIPPQALRAFSHSCTRFQKAKNNYPVGNAFLDLRAGDFDPSCKRINRQIPQQAGMFFERHFTPFAVLGEKEGLFTGYYEAAIAASLEKTDIYRYPVYATPNDLQRPYFTRQRIDQGGLRNRASILFWVADKLDLFVLHVQGSGIAILPNGDRFRVGYDSDNGHRYRSIGAALINAGRISRDQASWQNIRKWMENHPEQQNQLLWKNPRYIFFKIRTKTKAPIGSEGVPLTPQHSLAVDRQYIPLGLPLWVDIKGKYVQRRPIRTLMMAQDTGNAINGVVRGDFFWGDGDEAAEKAGKMRNPGRYFILLPNRAAERFVRNTKAF